MLVVDPAADPNADVVVLGDLNDFQFSDTLTILKGSLLHTLMDTLPPDTIVYPGHGQRTTLGAELARNPFLAELRAS